MPEKALPPLLRSAAMARATLQRSQASTCKQPWVKVALCVVEERLRLCRGTCKAQLEARIGLPLRHTQQCACKRCA